jgi:hypothetical protein
MSFTVMDRRQKCAVDGILFIFSTFMSFNTCTVSHKSRDSSVSASTGYRLDGRVRFLARARDFPYSTTSRPDLGPTQPRNEWVPGALLEGKSA